MYTLKERNIQEFEAEVKIKNFLAEGKIVSLKNACDILYYKHEIFAINALASGLIIKTKQFLNNCGLLNEYGILNFNQRFLDYGLDRICYTILSDNEDLIQRFSKLRYEKGVNSKCNMDEMVANGEMPIWCNTVQFFMANDNEGVERNLNIIETKTLKNLSKKEEGLKDDYEYYKGLYSGDKAKMEEVLDKLTSPKIHKKRNDNPILNQYISLPAFGYAKLAWRKGIKVNVKSPLVPEDLLPIEPLDIYEIPYDFLM
jgi:Immunity protein 49